MSMRRIALETYRTGEEYAKLEKEKDAIKRKQDIDALFKDASKVLMDMCAKKVALMHGSSIDPYATNASDVIYLKVDDEMEVKAMRIKESVALYVLSGGLYKSFSNLTDLGRILHEDEAA